MSTFFYGLYNVGVVVTRGTKLSSGGTGAASAFSEAAEKLTVLNELLFFQQK
ncbi:hypothetical protein ACIQWI_21200 [Peribacillus frigoritolerans]